MTLDAFKVKSRAQWCENTARVVVLLGAAGQAGAVDVAWLDDVLLCRLP